MSEAIPVIDSMHANREGIVAIARTWLNTPYVLQARVKGAGADCASLLAEILIESGLSEREELGVYSHDWFCNTDKEKYMIRLLRHATRTLDAVAYKSTKVDDGNIVLTRVNSKIYNHAGIATKWPLIIHAIAPKVEECDASRHPMWAGREIVVFDPFKDHAMECRASF